LISIHKLCPQPVLKRSVVHCQGKTIKGYFSVSGFHMFVFSIMPTPVMRSLVIYCAALQVPGSGCVQQFPQCPAQLQNFHLTYSTDPGKKLKVQELAE
jgi:hypothetical protein